MNPNSTVTEMYRAVFIKLFFFINVILCAQYETIWNFILHDNRAYYIDEIWNKSGST